MNYQELEELEDLYFKKGKYFLKKVLSDIENLSIVDILSIDDPEIIDKLQKIQVRIEEKRAELEMQKQNLINNQNNHE